MQSRDFCYWLQGFFEITAAQGRGDINMNSAQTEMIKNHLALVFKHEIDPAMGDKKHQAELNKIHTPTDGNVVFRC
jgi:hypothetical protein